MTQPLRSRAHAIPRVLATLVLLVLAGVISGSAEAQTPSAQAAPAASSTQAPALLKVFLDCDECDTEFLKQNVAFVDYVRDRNVSDVHVLVTTQDTGGGGMAWTLKFIGVGRFQAQDRTITFNTGSTATSDERRREFARLFKVGVVGYAADSSAAKDLDVTWARKDAAAATPTKDPWNYWVFSANAGGNMNGQSLNKSRSYRGSFSANRTTENWKISLSAGRNTSRSTYIVDPTLTIVNNQHQWNVNSLVVKSLGPRLSFGGRANASHSSYSNNDKSFTAAPGIEFDLFPYKESSARSLTFQYNVGATHYDYRQVTIFDKLTETVPHHAITTSLGLRQPWGSVSASASVTQHLNHTERYDAGVFGSAEVRLFKGFSFNVYTNYSKIKNQIGLPKGNASTEEILLQIRQLQTDYSYFASFGMSYRFGSIFNTIVNPRFGGSGGGGFFFF
jgi:hypothetical protein